MLGQAPVRIVDNLADRHTLSARNAKRRLRPAITSKNHKRSIIKIVLSVPEIARLRVSHRHAWLHGHPNGTAGRTDGASLANTIGVFHAYLSILQVILRRCFQTHTQNYVPVAKARAMTHEHRAFTFAILFLEFRLLFAKVPLPHRVRVQQQKLVRWPTFHPLVVPQRPNVRAVARQDPLEQGLQHDILRIERNLQGLVVCNKRKSALRAFDFGLSVSSIARLKMNRKDKVKGAAVVK